MVLPNAAVGATPRHKRNGSTQHHYLCPCVVPAHDVLAILGYDALGDVGRTEGIHVPADHPRVGLRLTVSCAVPIVSFPTISQHT